MASPRRERQAVSGKWPEMAKEWQKVESREAWDVRSLRPGNGLLQVTHATLDSMPSLAWINFRRNRLQHFDGSLRAGQL
jgi:hypothetical protein